MTISSKMKGNNMNSNVMKVLLLIVIILLVLISIKYLKSHKKKEGFSDNTITVSYYYMPGCKYCKQFDPEWDQFCAKAPANVKPIKKDGTGEYSEEASQKNVSGFPTIIITSNDTDTVYDQDRTASSLLVYLNKM